MLRLIHMDEFLVLTQVGVTSIPTPRALSVPGEIAAREAVDASSAGRGGNCNPPVSSQDSALPAERESLRS
jgi:hypothetical protein